MAFKILGTCDNVTTCGLCGKDNLKRTVALDNGHETVYYGTTCASKVTKRAAGYIRQKARKAMVLTCEECPACSDAVRYVGTLGRILCTACVDSHHAAMIYPG